MVDGTQRYRLTPAVGVFRGIPLPRADSVPSGPPETESGPGFTTLRLGGIASDAVEPARVQREAEAPLRRCQARLRQGDRGAERVHGSDGDAHGSDGGGAVGGVSWRARLGCPRVDRRCDGESRMPCGVISPPVHCGGAI
jgi:hypothetical protein